MSLELSIFKRLLKEAILSQTEFLDKVSQTYTDRARLPDDKILARLLELIDETQILSLTGKANKKNRKKVENFIDDQVKAMTAEDGTSVSIRDIRKLYDGIIKYLAPDESGKRKSDVSFDQCIRYSDIFLKTIYPNLAPDEKAIVDRGDFPYSEVFNLVSDYQKLSVGRPLEVDIVYEDEVVKIAYPLNFYSFENYVSNNSPNAHWENIWCTLGESTWTSYSGNQFLTVAYVKEHYRKDHSLSLISLKIDFEGNVLYEDTCDYYNEHLDKSFKEYLSDECIEKIKSYFLDIKETVRSNVLEAYKSLKALERLKRVEEFASKILYITSFSHVLSEIEGLGESIKEYLTTLPKKFFNEVAVEFISNFHVLNYQGSSDFILYIKESLIESFKSDGELFNMLYQKALKRNLNPKYAGSFIRYFSSYALNVYFDKEDGKAKSRKKLKEGEGSIIFANACNGNNPDLYRNLCQYYQSYGSYEITSKEELDEIVKKMFLSKSFISFYKDKLDKIFLATNYEYYASFINKHIKSFAECHEEVTRRAKTEPLDIKEILNSASTRSILSDAYAYLQNVNSRISVNILYEKLIELISKYNKELNTNNTIETVFKQISVVEDFIYSLDYTVSIIACSDIKVEENLLRRILERCINYIASLARYMVSISSSYHKYLDIIVQFIIHLDRSDIYKKLTKDVVEAILNLEVDYFLPDIYMTILGVNEDFNQIDNIDNHHLKYLFKIPGFKKTLQTSFIASNYNLLFNHIFNLYDYELTSLFDSQIKFISENFKSETLINILREYFNEYESNINYIEKRSWNDKESLENFASQKEIVRIPLKKYLGIEVFSKDQEESEELVRDYVKTQL